MRITILAIVLSIAFPVQASTETFKYGFSPSLSLYNLADPDGSTETTVIPSLLSFSAKYKASKRYSYWITQISHTSSAFDASTSNVGQDVVFWDFAAGYETRVPVNRRLEFYAAGLLGATQGEYASRHTVDTDGFLAERFEKRTSTDPFLKIQAAYYTKFTKHLEFGLVPAYQHSLNSGFSGPSLTTVVYF